MAGGWWGTGDDGYLFGGGGGGGERLVGLGLEYIASTAFVDVATPLHLLYVETVREIAGHPHSIIRNTSEITFFHGVYCWSYILRT